MCIQYIGGCSVHRGMFSTSGGYHEYIWGYHEYMYIGGYNEYIGGCSVHWGMFSTSAFSIEIERFLPTCSLQCIMIFPDVLNIPRCTHDVPPPPHMHYDIPDVLIIPRCTHDIPRYTHGIPQCTHGIPRCTHGILPMYSWYPPRH